MITERYEITLQTRDEESDPRVWTRNFSSARRAAIAELYNTDDSGACVRIYPEGKDEEIASYHYSLVSTIVETLILADGTPFQRVLSASET